MVPVEAEDVAVVSRARQVDVQRIAERGVRPDTAYAERRDAVIAGAPSASDSWNFSGNVRLALYVPPGSIGLPKPLNA